MASAIPDYDEDVILPNTPLSQYMQEFETFESDVLTENEELPIMRNDIFRNSFDIKGKLTYSGQFFLECFKQYLSFIYNIFVPCLIPFEYSELKYILDLAKNSRVLISEDLSVLLNYESDDESNAEFKLSYSSVFQQCFQLFAFVLIFIIMRSITISNIITNEDLLSLFSDDKSHFIYIPIQILVLIISIALYINIFIISAFIITNFVELLLCKIFCYSLKKKLHTTECIMIMVRKCLRLIQEAELIARGFTSASLPGIVERLELSTGLPISSPQRQYPELRKCIFMWTREMFMLYKSSTQKLIENKKFGPVLDFSSQSFAMLDLKEFGNLLKYDITFDSDLHELLKLTDGLSVSSLKTMYLLLELQVSEFYKYLYLITSFLISDDNLFHCTKKINYFHYFNFFVKSLQSKDMEVLKMSCDAHKFYKSIEAVSDVEEKSSTTQKSNSSHVEIFVHNMTLHLKAALKRLANLEELLESEKKSVKSSNEICLKKVDEVMKEIKSEIEVYHDYYLKCDNEVQNILYGKKPSSPGSIVGGKYIEQNEISKRAIITTCDSDPIIEDEIFEAIVTKSLQEKEIFSDDYSVDIQKQNFEVTGKLLRELKNVLIVKADEHRLREEKAMAKKVKLDRLPEINEPEELIDLVSKSYLAEPELATEGTFSDSSLSDAEISENETSNKEEENLIPSDSNTEDKLKVFPTAKDAFAASIAALALQRQKKLGIINDVCYSDSSVSDDEIVSS